MALHLNPCSLLAVLRGSHLSEPCVQSVVSNSLRLHGLMLARLLYPWDSPGRDTGVGCRALLQGIYPTQGSYLCLLPLPALAGAFVTTSATWEAHNRV